MSDFINTVDVLGEDITINRIIERLITEFKDDNVVTVGNEAFNGCSVLKTVDLPNAISIGTGAFRDSSVESFNAPKVESMGGNVFWGCVFTKAVFPELVSAGDYAFQYARKIVTADFTKLPKIVPSMFSGCNSLKNVFLRNETMCALASTSAFNACFHILGTVQADYNPRGLKDGYIYVPRALLNSYKAGTNWSTYADRFRAIEDYTVDGTITGKIDLSTSKMLVDGSLTEIVNDKITGVGAYSFRACPSLTKADFPKVTTIYEEAFRGCKLDALILRNKTMVTLTNANALSWTGPYNGTGYIYVPSALVDTYKADTNWSTYAAQFRAIEDYPEICG